MDQVIPVVDEIAKKKEASLNAELQKQFLEEYGDEPLEAHKIDHHVFAGHRSFDTSCLGCRDQEANSILRQKYGLIPTTLTDKERKIVTREERRRMADAVMRAE